MPELPISGGEFEPITTPDRLSGGLLHSKQKHGCRASKRARSAASRQVNWEEALQTSHTESESAGTGTPSSFYRPHNGIHIAKIP